MWLDECTGSKIDPAFTSHEQPVLQYTKAYYEKWLPMNTMRTTVDALTSCLGQATKKWCHARRLVAANILWLWQLDLIIVDAGNLVTDTEMKLYLTIDSAAFVAQQGTESVRRGIAAELECWSSRHSELQTGVR